MTGDKAPNIEGRTCALESCGVPFAPKRSTQRYCCREHGQIANNAKRAYGVAPGDGTDIDLERVATAQQKIAGLESALRHVVADRDQYREAFALATSLTEHQAHPPTWLTPKRPDKGHRATATLLLTDCHFDEVVNPDEIDGINAYDRKIAEARLKRLFERTIRMSREYLTGVRYDGAVVMLGGDLVSGIIHEELRETNFDMLYGTVTHFLDPLLAGIDMLATEFGKVHLVGVPGNHSRSKPGKPRFKGRARDTADWLIYTLLARDLRSDSRITFEIPEAMDARVTIYDTRYLLTHGNQFKGGSGIAGALSPLMLGVARKGQRERAAGRPYDYLAMGHWHQRMWIPGKGLIVGGSMIGFSEFDYGSNFTPEPPTQEFWLTTPEHGPTISAPIFVADRAREGW